MDSGNTSGSLQSSSGADEEYDSRAQSSSFSPFLNNPPPPPSQVAPFSTANNPHPLIPPPQNHHMFDPLSNYLDPITQSSISLPNLDEISMWSKPGRSQPNQTDLVSLIPCSSSSPSPSRHNLAFVSSQTRGSSGAFPTLPPESGSRGLMLSVSAANNDQIQTHKANTNTNTNPNMVRNPKKRSRASRRAPTTVLTTDTTNFRAMVQEFTGIPPPPFTSSSFPRTRLDLFASAAATPILRSNVNVNVNVNPLDPPTPPPYLLRPFAQKLQLRSLHPFPPPSFSNSLLPLTNSTTNSTSINCQQLSEHFGLVKQPLNFNNTPNTSTKYPLGNSSVLVSRTQQPSLEISPNLKMGAFEELGLRHDHVNTDLGCLHQNMVSSTSIGVGALSSGNNNNSLSNANSSTEWAQRLGTITNNDCDHGGGGALSGTVNYSDIAERVTNGKVHYSASSSDFRGEKGSEFTVTARTQGMVESWINCSSD
ncbi:hypothetical protein VNO78_10717 [Psophocarpus tetragonolobus]|uniref:VQ domain-containing protein n=1 Tax=Psophocarpus tetragonolobus TaxID=3891 RepID=A0AAN9XN90_PSOTE